MDFPILDLMDQDVCYRRLLDLPHPDGLTCPGCGGGRDRYTVYRRREGSPVVAYRTWDADRPPVYGVVGRSSGRLALRVGHRNRARSWRARQSCRGPRPWRRCTPTSGRGTRRWGPPGGATRR